MFVTNKELIISAKGTYPTIPKGTLVNYSKKCECYFIDPLFFSKNSFNRFDAIYYGFRVDKKDIVGINV